MAASLTDENRYRLLVDAITDYAIYMLDPQGVVSSWNAGAQRFKGYEAHEIIGEHFSRFYTDEDRDAGLPELALRTAATEGRFEREGWRVRKDGGRFWAHVIIDAIHGDDGALLGYAKITRDLTERRRAEEALRGSEEQFRLLVQGVTDYAIYRLDLEGRVSSWNAGAERIKGYRPDEIIGKHFSHFYTDEDRALGVPREGLETARRTGRWDKEGWRVRKDGSRFWAHVVIDAIRDDEGQVIGFAKITRDNTERRKAQADLDSAREALFQSQKLEAVGKLTGGVAHDFNNLLMAVLGSLDLLKKRLKDPELLPLVETAIGGAQRGASLTQRMLAFARRQELTIGAVDLARLVVGMRDLISRSINSRIELAIDLPDDLPLVMADAGQLEAALLNLCVNARDAMPDGGRITITASAEDVALSRAALAAGRYVKLSVVDTGQGMSAETLARAAEPFYTTKGVGKGTGLGLSMVQGLVAQAEGELVIHSLEGEGATIELWLPVAQELQAPVDALSAPPLRAAIERPLSVLAVDDDALVLANTAALLEDLGHRVVQVPGGAEALAHLETGEHFDVILTDQVMPRMSGLELREAARALRPEVPVLIATGYAELPASAPRDVLRIAKPFRQDALAAALARTLAAAA